jgi:hypothetical protein
MTWGSCGSMQDGCCRSRASPRHGLSQGTPGLVDFLGKPGAATPSATVYLASVNGGLEHRARLGPLETCIACSEAACEPGACRFRRTPDLDRAKGRAWTGALAQGPSWSISYNSAASSLATGNFSQETTCNYVNDTRISQHPTAEIRYRATQRGAAGCGGRRPDPGS